MRPLVITYRTRVRAAAPQAVAIASGLGWLYGKAINGSAGGNGAIRYGLGAGDIQAQRTSYPGYVFPPQIFTGHSAKRVAAGAIRNTPPGLPSTNVPDTVLGSPLARAMATVGARQMAGG